MKKSRCIISCIYVLLCAGSVTAARADQPLLFSSTLSASDQVAVSKVLEGGIKDYVFSYADLNGDDADEVVAVNASCKSDAPTMCEYTVLGIGQDQAHVLLQETAWGLAVSDERAFGVRKLSVFKSKNNQYRATPYTWNALESRYTETEGDNRT